MIIYILLSLSLVLASKESADKIYYCTSRMVKDPINHDYTVREIVQGCTDEIAPNIQIKEAKLTEATTVYMDLYWLENGKKIGRQYAFNTVVNCKKNDLRQAPVNSLLMNIDIIMSQTENSVSANSCWENTKLAGIGGGMALERQGFGYKKEKGKCVRACKGDGQILIGTVPPFTFSDGKNGTHLLAARRPASQNNTKKDFATMDLQLLDTQCVMCPKDKKNSSYVDRHKDYNKCVDIHGCPEGTEYYPVANNDPNNPPDHTAMMYRFPGAPPGCVVACEPHQKRINGECKADEKKSCDELKAMKTKLDSISSRFTQTSQTSRVGNCDMNQMRQYMKEWSTGISARIDRDANSGSCKNSNILNGFVSNNFLMYLSAQGKHRCLQTIDQAPRNLDAKIYAIMQESFSSKFPGLTIIN